MNITTRKVTLVKNCKTCAFYDDGCGNGAYQSGMDAHEKACKHPKNISHKIPKSANNLPVWCPLIIGEFTKIETTIIKLA